MKLIIEDDEGRKTVVPLAREEITIGRQDGNTIRLTERNVSRRHARLLKENGNLLIEDLGSYNGVRVNGEKISAPTKIKEGDLVEIGDYDLGVQGKFESMTPRQLTIPPSSMKPPPPPPRQPTIPPTQAVPPVAAPASPPAEKEKPPAPAPPPSPSAGGETAIIRVSDVMKSAPQVEARDLERSEMPRLVGLPGAFRGKEFYLMRSEVKFGRTDENDLVIDHQSVSRQHGKFVLDQGQWKVVDNKSANGVRVNGEEYAVSNVKAGDTIELGHLKFRFCAPGEKFTLPAEEKEEKKGARPTAAELIAGARAPAAEKRGRRPALIAAAAAAGLLVLVAVGVFALRSAGRNSDNGEVSGEDAVRQGDLLFKQRKYRAALEKYELAGDEPTPNRKKAAEEARGEDKYESLKRAVDSGDGDKARNLLESCAAESTFYCQKASELADSVKTTYVKKHLAVAAAAKASGKLDVCMAEAGNVLSFDSANSEAQALQQQCLAPPPKAELPPRKEGPSPKEREARAAKLARASADKLIARDFAGAVKDAQAALAQNPNDKSTLGAAYKSLGYGYAYLNDRANAVKWLEKFVPYCSDDCDKVHTYIGK